MKVLLLGSGAREHALAWALTRTGRVKELLSLPGNPGMAALGPIIEGVSIADVGAIAALARVHRVDLVVVGPEAPLAAGVADVLHRLGIPVFGPTRSAARLETSKTFAKQVMIRAGVPTPAAASFTDLGPALSHLAATAGPYVVKADGLAAGKGVLVTESSEQARDWVRRCLDGEFGEGQVVIEEFVEGPELSVFAVCDGTDALLLEPARDYKRALDHDQGPNTGGMGSYSPVELEPGFLDRIRTEVFLPTLRQMGEEGNPYVGFLYAGLVLSPDGPRVIEFNARLGDPETQVVLPRLRTDLLSVIETALGDGVGGLELEWDPGAAVNVVLASAHYPESSPDGKPIGGIETAAQQGLVFHAGTRLDGRRLVTSGGRVLSVVGRGATAAEARDAAYRAVETIRFEGMRYRSDIAAG